MIDLNDPVIRELVGARVNLLFHKPFFGNLVTRLELVDASTWCSTAATDGKRFYYNRDFVKKLTREQLVFLFGHEILHCIYDHLGRRGNRKPELWNMANDYIVNYTLVHEKVGIMPDVGLISDQYTDEMTSEEVYKLLEQNQVKIQATLDEHLELGQAGDESGSNNQDEGAGNESDRLGGDNSKPSDGSTKGKKKVTATISGKDGPPKLSKDELEKIRAELRAAVITAASAVNTGNLPAGIRRLVQDLTEPMIDWRTLLEVHMQACVKEDFTWMRPNKRSWACNAILPGQNLSNSIEAMVFIDTSGSISDDMLKDFLGEVKGIMDTFPEFTIHLASIDAEVYNYVKYQRDNLDEIFEYKAKGGGGNDFPRMFSWMRENEIEPPVMICFTDGWPCGSWGDPKYCDDVIWVVHGDGGEQPTFGTRIPYVKD